MSDYALVQRGSIAASSADGAGPKDFTLATAVKLGSAFVVGHIRDKRRRTSVQRGVQNFTNATAFPVSVALGTAVDDAAAQVNITFKDSRATTPTVRGVTARLINAGADIEFNAAALGVGETLDVAWEVIEHKTSRQATLRLINATTVRLEWDGALAAGETITAMFEVFDFEDAGDDLKRVLFNSQRMLGYLAENMLQDLIIYDDAGNMTQYRMRLFNSKTNAEAATVDIADASPLETGEWARVTVTQDINFQKNDRLSLLKVLTDLIATPGVS